MNYSVVSGLVPTELTALGAFGTSPQAPQCPREQRGSSSSKERETYQKGREGGRGQFTPHSNGVPLRYSGMALQRFSQIRR